ncbi:hypothetical protein E5676_scaffold1721G00040 [Cucumis melo var. makuwa]|uniref:Uncharacterized protein n=1 Tax=Cucumis melo var. makuwa TaxID=1194695 RepID=A0A5D3DDJ9_CUCMM|nr:hypothetical protein E6C27_scaffold908G00200 [Cucumis melo var. makuwa]TYK21757.1 hypothetical protein E5676_scaffold1721G00040 [Cucumis melo var. makuwa]
MESCFANNSCSSAGSRESSYPRYNSTSMKGRTVLGQAREDKILRLDSLMDGVLPTEEMI